MTSEVLVGRGWGVPKSKQREKYKMSFIEVERD